MWVRNAQMGLTSVTLGVVSTIVKDRQAIAERGFFQGYTKLVWTVIIIQAVGGLNVAFILKYADNILKGFAAAFSTLASCVLEMAIMHFRPTATFLLGGADQRRGLLLQHAGFKEGPLQTAEAHNHHVSFVYVSHCRCISNMRICAVAAPAIAPP